MRILLVEDDPHGRAILHGILADLGVVEVFEASDGAAAWRLIEGQFDFFDMVICDWNMPYMNGLELLQAVRQRTKTLPFLMISGRHDSDSVLKARDSGAQAYIAKPYDTLDIAHKIKIHGPVWIGS